MELLGITWTPEVRQIGELRNWDKNPRKIGDKEFESLKQSIKDKGLFEVLTVDTDNTVLSGNQRLRALTELGQEKIWCMVPERKLSEEERDRIGIRANQLSGVWDVEMLANAFDVPVLLSEGFNKIDLGMMPLQEDGFDAAEEIKKIDTPISQTGDIFQLGRHRIMCGDSTSPEVVEALMGGAKARLLFTDPPYGVDYVSGAARGDSSKHSKIANDDLVGDKLKHFLLKSFFNAFHALSDDATFYSWFANSTQAQFREAMEGAGFRFAQIIVWLKPKFVLSRSDYHHQYEPCMYGWKNGQKHFANPKLRSYADVQSVDVDTFADQLDVWFINRDHIAEYTHPTQKPIKLAERALRMNTEHGDGVLDLFLGSASTLIAAEQAGRVCYGLELDPKYVDLAVRRFKKFSPGVSVECLTRPLDMAQFV